MSRRQIYINPEHAATGIMAHATKEAVLRSTSSQSSRWMGWRVRAKERLGRVVKGRAFDGRRRRARKEVKSARHERATSKKKFPVTFGDTKQLVREPYYHVSLHS